MPTVLRLSGFRFFFYNFENGEPSHIHITNGDKVAKYWLSSVELASPDGFHAHELNKLRSLVIEHSAEFQQKWNEHFSTQSGPDRS